MALPLPKPKALLADKGYDGDRFRENLLMRGILPIIPPRSNRKVPVHPDYRRYRDRNRVERMFGKLKQQRRIATRYDKPVLSFESFLNLAASRLWLKSFVNKSHSTMLTSDPTIRTNQIFNATAFLQDSVAENNARLSAISNSLKFYVG
jgi:transposase